MRYLPAWKLIRANMRFTVRWGCPYFLVPPSASVWCRNPPRIFYTSDSKRPSRCGATAILHHCLTVPRRVASLIPVPGVITPERVSLSSSLADDCFLQHCILVWSRHAAHTGGILVVTMGSFRFGISFAGSRSSNTDGIHGYRRSARTGRWYATYNCARHAKQWQEAQRHLSRWLNSPVSVIPSLVLRSLYSMAFPCSHFFATIRWTTYLSYTPIPHFFILFDYPNI